MRLDSAGGGRGAAHPRLRRSRGPIPFHREGPVAARAVAVSARSRPLVVPDGAGAGTTFSKTKVPAASGPTVGRLFERTPSRGCYRTRPAAAAKRKLDLVAIRPTQ